MHILSLTLGVIAYLCVWFVQTAIHLSIFCLGWALILGGVWTVFKFLFL